MDANNLTAKAEPSNELIEQWKEESQIHGYGFLYESAFVDGRIVAWHEQNNVSTLQILFDSIKILSNTCRVRFEVSFITKGRVAKKSNLKWRVVVDGERFLDEDLPKVLKKALKYVYEKYKSKISNDE